MKLSSHPLWLVGFRPFLGLACLSGLFFPLLWALIFTGSLSAPQTSFLPVQWHAHEMFFGFGWAVLGVFGVICKFVEIHGTPRLRQQSHQVMC